MKKVASFLWMSTTFFWKSVRPYRDRGRWSLPQDAFAFGILYCNEISDSNWRWTDSIRFMLLYFQQPNFLYPAKSLLNFIENERFDVNHVIIFISRVNIIFQKKKRRLRLHNRIQFLSWTRIPSAHINLGSIPPLRLLTSTIYVELIGSYFLIALQRTKLADRAGVWRFLDLSILPAPFARILTNYSGPIHTALSLPVLHKDSR